MRTKAAAVGLVLMLLAGLPLASEASAADAPLRCPGVVEVPGGWLLTRDVTCILSLEGEGTTLDLGGHTVTGGVYASDDQTVRNGTLVMTDAQFWYSFTLSHMTVRPLVPGGCPGWCIDAGALTVEHSTFRDIGGAALNFYNGGGGTIRHSVFIGNDRGIVIDLDGDVLMEHNVFIDNGVGIDLNTHDGEGVSHNTVRNSVFWGNGTGVSMAHYGELGAWGPGLSYNTLERNWFLQNEEAGLAIEVTVEKDPCERCLPPVDNVVDGNLFWGNGRQAPAGSPDDGVTARGLLYDSDTRTSEDHPEALAGFTLTGNQAYLNADLGFDVAGVIDGGGNRARLNGDRAQCLGLDC